MKTKDKLSKLRIINYELRIGLHLIISKLQKINQEVIFNHYKVKRNNQNLMHLP